MTIEDLRKKLDDLERHHCYEISTESVRIILDDIEREKLTSPKEPEGVRFENSDAKAEDEICYCKFKKPVKNKDEVLEKLERWATNMGYSLSDGDLFEIIQNLKSQPKEPLKSSDVNCPTFGAECEIGGDGTGNGSTHYYVPKSTGKLEPVKGADLIKESKHITEEEIRDMAIKFYNENYLEDEVEYIVEGIRKGLSLRQERDAILFAEWISENHFKLFDITDNTKLWRSEFHNWIKYNSQKLYSLFKHNEPK